MKSLHDELHPAEKSRSAVDCVHVTKLGIRCSRKAVEGAEFCVLHGAAITLAREMVERRLVALHEKALETLEEIVAEAGDDKTRLAAVTAIFDRTGFGPKTTVTIDKRITDLSTLTDEEFVELAQKTYADARAALIDIPARPKLVVGSRVNEADDVNDAVH